MADDRAQARREAATLLNVDIANPSPADALRIDMISALRLVIDVEQASVLAGSSADLGKLNVAVQSLIALLPGRELPASEQDNHPDPRQVMWRIYSEMRTRGEVPDVGWHQHRINGLEAEVATLRAQLVAGGLAPALPDVPMAATGASAPVGKRIGKDGGSSVIDPTEVVLPGEWRGETYAGPRGPDDPPKPVTIEGSSRAERPGSGVENQAPAAPSSREPWADWVDGQLSGSVGGDRWSNRNIP